jgi:uncharacterized protein YyaL (SSP411 family)
MSRKSSFFRQCYFMLVCAPVLVSCGDAVSPSQAGQAQQPNMTDTGKINTTLPGTGASSDELDARLRQAWAKREPGYKPRTQHLQPDGTPKYTNRLFFESSPYLLQHAHNPMNWHPWGDEAFEKARALGRPVLLSVGYSTCHWCHVMEEESFDDEEVARYINENYIPIKVDREVRPDIDAIYMSAVQAMRGRGGWPMTVWLTPDREPFYAGTYFPARDGDRGANMGFLTLLAKLKGIYDNEPDRVTKQTQDITAAIDRMMEPQAGTETPGAEVLHGLASFYKGRFDQVNGGTKGSPKFPSSLPVRALLRYHRRSGDQRALEMAELTLEKMAGGGIYDQTGGGFHRYSTDERWLVPHFEKMLYDNALLVTAYLEGYQATGREDFAAVARDILRYVERDMTSPDGAFYSATDADSFNPDGEREEGWFFTWTPAEIVEVLGEERAKAVAAYYAVSEKGNFEGRNIFHRPKPAAEVAGPLGLSAEELRSIVSEAREELYVARAERPPPLRDDKILTAWNGLMISAHAQAALVLGDADYARRAEKAAAFLLKNLRRDGRLLRSYKSGQARHNAYLDDYACLIAALLDLYEATGKPDWLREAAALEEVLEEQYQDEENGGFFMTSDDHEELLAREKPSYDGAEPSGNSVAAMNLVRLHEFTTEDRYRKTAERAFQAFGPILKKSPATLSEMVLALDFQLDTPKEIIIVTPGSRGEAEPFLARLRQTFLPNRVLAVIPEAELSAHVKLLPLVDGKRAIKGKPTAYVCEKRVCELPTSDPEIFARQIGKVKPLEQSASR